MLPILLSFSLLLLSSFISAHPGSHHQQRGRHGTGVGMEKRMASLIKSQLEKKALEVEVEGEMKRNLLKKRGTCKAKIAAAGRRKPVGTSGSGTIGTSTAVVLAAATEGVETPTRYAVMSSATATTSSHVSTTSDSPSPSTTTKLSPTTSPPHTHTSSATGELLAVAATSSTKATASPIIAASSSTSSGCFPLSGIGFPASGNAPAISRSNWWCGPTKLYGFLGFSYPLEVTDCSDPSNSYANINADFKQMKSQFGASMVRIYAPQCRDVSIWENLVKAGLNNGMGIIVMVWWGFQADQSLWKQTESSIYSLFTTSSLAPLAPYVVHSASFGSEPIGDGVDGGNFISDLAAFKAKMSSFGVPVGISEDWDRPGVMDGSSGNGLAGMGEEVKSNTGITHAHVMPYYHTDQVATAADAWSYIAKWVSWFPSNVGQQVLITETMWASYLGSHGRGAFPESLSVSSFATYWNAFANNCETFKKYNTGWFIHTWSDAQEPGFGMIDSSGNSKIPGYYPKKC